MSDLQLIRDLEKKAIALGVLEKDDVKTAAEMREEAWECYLVSRRDFLEYLIKGVENV